MRHGAGVAKLVDENLAEFVRMLFTKVIDEVLPGAADGDSRQLVVGDADIVSANAAFFDSLTVAMALTLRAVLSYVVALVYLYLYIPL